ncbi:hypothetical protein FPV67DRAFT_647934 [Lyophyllum atratum]|nr:hypothetical protein FPV67DRAFT_647934 [Lyophyllum atratum]
MLKCCFHILLASLCYHEDVSSWVFRKAGGRANSKSFVEISISTSETHATYLSPKTFRGMTNSLCYSLARLCVSHYSHFI